MNDNQPPAVLLLTAFAGVRPGTQRERSLLRNREAAAIETREDKAWRRLTASRGVKVA